MVRKRRAAWGAIVWTLKRKMKKKNMKVKWLIKVNGTRSKKVAIIMIIIIIINNNNNNN